MAILIPWPLAGEAAGERVIRIDASQYAFSPAEVTVARGQNVILELVSTDVVHGLYLDGYDLQISADPGQTSRLTFTADRAGTFRFRCSVTCGPLHPFMIGKLHVQPNGNSLRMLVGVLLATVAGVAYGFQDESPKIA